MRLIRVDLATCDQCGESKKDTDTVELDMAGWVVLDDGSDLCRGCVRELRNETSASNP